MANRFNNVIGDDIDGIVAIVVAGYLVAVVYQGNAAALGAALVKDGPDYLQALIAIYVLSLLVNIKGPVGDIATGLVALAILGLTIKIASKGVGDLQAYGAGKISLFELVKKLATK